MYLELARETSTRKLYTDELQWSCEVSYSLRAISYAYHPKELASTIVCFYYSEQKVEIKAGFTHVLITQLDKNLTLAWLMIVCKIPLLARRTRPKGWTKVCQTSTGRKVRARVPNLNNIPHQSTYILYVPIWI